MQIKQRARAVSYESDQEFIAPIDELNWFNQRYIKYNEYMRNIYNDNYYEGCDVNDICYRIMQKHWYDEGSEVVPMVIRVQKEFEIYDKLSKAKKERFTNWWFITLTSKPEWTEIEAKAKIDKYREARFKTYKYIYVEEHGTESEKYHQHILVESDVRFHTGQNLKKTKYYDANINIQRVTDTHRSKVDIVKYMTKENQPLGDLVHFGLSN